MNTGSALGSRLPAMGAVFAPLLIVIGVRTFIGGPVATTAAAGLPGPDPTLMAIAPPTPISGQDSRLIAWIKSHANTPAGVSPMQRAEQRTFVADPVPTPAATPSAEPSPLDHLRVTAIMGHNQSGVATIGGRMLRFGEEVVGGWKITTIDARQRFIELTDKDGVKTQRLYLDHP